MIFLEPELPPCPFCASDQVTTSPCENITDDDRPEVTWAAICKACGARVDRDTEAEAIAAWNTRTAHDSAMGERVESLAAALAKIRDLNGENYDSDRAWALAMQLRARCELHGWLGQTAANQGAHP